MEAILDEYRKETEEINNSGSHYMISSYTIEKILRVKGWFAYTAVGKSMLPLVRQNRDIIVLRRKDPDTRCKRYDVVLYKRGDQNVLHRILKVRENDYVICGDHNFQREYGITDKQIIGVMTRLVRDGKSIYPTDWKYKLYVHLWCDFFPVRAAILYVKKMIRRARRRLVERNSK